MLYIVHVWYMDQRKRSPEKERYKSARFEEAKSMITAGENTGNPLD
jgi:hypothetical protein